MTRSHRRFLLTARRVLAEAESLREMLAGLGVDKLGSNYAKARKLRK